MTIMIKWMGISKDKERFGQRKTKQERKRKKGLAWIPSFCLYAILKGMHLDWLEDPSGSDIVMPTKHQLSGKIKKERENRKWKNEEFKILNCLYILYINEKVQTQKWKKLNIS